MTNKYEQFYLTNLAHRLASKFSARSVVATELSNWTEDQDLGFDWDPDIDHFKKRGIPSEVWTELQQKLSQQQHVAGQPKAALLARNIHALASHMDLNMPEASILELAIRAARGGPVRTLCNSLTDDARLSIEETVLALTALEPAQVRPALSHSGKLLMSGLVQFERGNFTGLGIVPLNRVVEAVDPPSRGLGDILARLFDPVSASAVSWHDFEHLGAGRDFAFRLLKGAVARCEPGVNILLHSAPGTGKTEFCKVLADQVSASLHAVGETDDDGDEPSRFERLQQLRLGQRLLAHQGKSIILFDEMEDLFTGMDGGLFGGALRRTGSKVHINRLLESNPVPTLWTTNNISDCDPAFLRRISFTLELRTPPISVRSQIWSKRAEHHQVPLPQHICLELAQSMDDAPALADSAIQAAQITGGGAQDVKLAAGALSRAIRGGHTPITAQNNSSFEPGLANADHDLTMIAERFVACGPTNTGGLCLSGPPGTGKSAFARYLAENMQMPVLERRASDLLDRYVGGSERNIADAFAEARDTTAFLVFDEADSLLGARDSATHRWEISQVNEMLTWMESHPLPFACTTNLIEHLDPATARRFSLKISFLPLSVQQRAACFRRFFKAEPPKGLAGLDYLTPGDFAVVAKRSTLLGITEPDALIAELHREQEAKPNTPNRIGFRAAR